MYSYFLRVLFRVRFSLLGREPCLVGVRQRPFAGEGSSRCLTLLAPLWTRSFLAIRTGVALQAARMSTRSRPDLYLGRITAGAVTGPHRDAHSAGTIPRWQVGYASGVATPSEIALAQGTVLRWPHPRTFHRQLLHQLGVHPRVVMPICQWSLVGFLGHHHPSRVSHLPGQWHLLLRRFSLRSIASSVCQGWLMCHASPWVRISRVWTRQPCLSGRLV